MSSKSDQQTRIDASRKAAVTAAADLFEGIAQFKRHQRRSLPDDRRNDERRAGKTDFIFDLLRLNIDYVTRIAELSQQHHELASRSLERLYNIAAPRVLGRHSPELVFGGPDGVWERTFTLENRLDPDITSATISCGLFQGPRPSVPRAVQPKIAIDRRALAVLPTRTLTNEVDGHSAQVKIDYRRPHTVELTLPEAEFPEQRLFSAEISVEMGSRLRRIPITVDTRRRGKHA